MTQETNEPTLVERVEETQTSLFSKVKNVAVPLTAAALAGGATFAGVDISSLDEATLTYVFNPYTTAVIPTVAMVTGVAAHKYAGKLWNGIKWLTDKVVFPISRALSGGEDPKLVQNAFRDRKVKGCTVLGLASILGAGVLNHYEQLPFSFVDTKSVETTIKQKLDEVVGWPGQRNVHFLKNYVFGSPLDGIPIPPKFEDDVAAENLNAWHTKHFGTYFGQSNYGSDKTKINGSWRVMVDIQDLRIANLVNEKGIHYTIQVFADNRPKKNFRNHYLKDSKIVAPAVGDWLMYRRQGHPDVVDTLLKLEAVDGGKAYTIVMRNSIEEDVTSPDIITIRELGKKKPLFGTPVVAYDNSYIKLKRETSWGVNRTVLYTRRWTVPDKTKRYGFRPEQKTYLVYGQEKNGKLHVYRASEDGRVEELDSSNYSLNKPGN